MGGPRRGAIGLANTKAPMVRGWSPSKSLSPEDGSRGFQMGPVVGGKRSGASLPEAPPPPPSRLRRLGHPHLNYHLLCIDTTPPASQVPGLTPLRVQVPVLSRRLWLWGRPAPRRGTCPPSGIAFSSQRPHPLLREQDVLSSGPGKSPTPHTSIAKRRN